MKTDLTKEIVKACYFFNLAMPTNKRTPRYADEVWTPTGIVDVIRFEDYIANNKSICVIECPEAESSVSFREEMLKKNYKKCKIEGLSYPNKNCKGCFYLRHSYELGILTTCFEVKISVSDFKSKNGHNFHGNNNYYVVPIDIYDKIMNLVPDDIGIIVYYPKSKSMRIKKKCKFKKIDEEILTGLMYNAFKKWCDGAITTLGRE